MLEIIFAVAIWSLVIFLGVLLAKRIRSTGPGRAPAPKLNPRWDTSVCKHEDVVEVFAWNETDPIAYICTNPDCYAKVELGEDRAMRAKADATYVQITADMEGFRTKLIQDKSAIERKAEEFAAKTRHQEKLAADRKKREYRRKQDVLKTKRAPKGSWY